MSRLPQINEPPAAEPFHVEVEQRDGATVIVPHGELDIGTAPELQEALDAAVPGAVVLDLRDLDFIDSTGLHLLLAAEARARSDSTDLKIAAGHEVHRVFEMAGVRGQFTYIDLD
jgi:anti-anti-sigma factor